MPQVSAVGMEERDGSSFYIRGFRAREILLSESYCGGEGAGGEGQNFYYAGAGAGDHAGAARDRADQQQPRDHEY